MTRPHDSHRSRVPLTSGWVLSLVAHAIIVALAAVTTWSVANPASRPPVVTLGDAATPEALGDAEQAEADAAASAGATTAAPDRAAPPPLPAPPSPLDPPPPAPSPLDASAFTAADPALASLDFGGSPADAPAGGAGLLQGTSGEFQRLVRGMGQQGLDVVLVIDATDSMDPTLDDAKGRLRDVINVLTGILRDAGGGETRDLVRFGVVAFKDHGDEYGMGATRHLALTDDVDAVHGFIDRIVPGGGGDRPEPIHRALAVAGNADRLGWKRGRKGVILLVGDAPVHTTGREEAVHRARRFASTRGGTVSTIDVGGTGDQAGARTSLLPDFQAIAEAGGGSAFLLRDRDRFWRYLITSIFGDRYERDIDLIVEKYAGGGRE